MMRRCIVLLVAAVLSGCSDAQERSAGSADSTAAPEPTAAAPAPGRDSAFYALRVYPLDSFPQIPSDVRAAFMTIGCGEIPQTYTSRAPGNVVQGEFSASGQMDWAALCHRNGTTELTVVWGGPSKCSSRIWPSPSGSDRFIALATMDDILRHAKTYDGPQPPARDHAGIHDGVAEKASTIRFCHQGQWIELYGAD